MRSPAAILALSLWPLPSVAQTFQATLSRDTVPMGEVFELRVRVPVPPGSVVYFPDTVARTEVLESHAAVTWDVEEGSGGGATLSLTYPVIAWGVGVVPVSGFDVFVASSGSAARDAPRLPGGSYVGTWTEAPIRGDASVRPLRVPRHGVWVTPVFGEEQMRLGVEPMPSADVVGASWHWPSILLGLLFAGGLVALGVREWRRLAGVASRERAVMWTAATSRRDALEQLDLLIAEQLPAAGRTHELYTRSSAIVRRFVGRMDPKLGADLTSSEVMDRLHGRTNGGRGAALFHEMGAAEVVKFGRARPGEGEALAHLRSLREWVADCGDSL